jgi:hypothetical protein
VLCFFTSTLSTLICNDMTITYIHIILCGVGLAFALLCSALLNFTNNAKSYIDLTERLIDIKVVASILVPILAAITIIAICIKAVMNERNGFEYMNLFVIMIIVYPISQLAEKLLLNQKRRHG